MKLVIQCPSRPCKGHIAPIEVGDIATEVYDRGCRKCGARWRIVATPLRKNSPSVSMHKLTWTCTRDATKRRCGECDSCQEYELSPNQAPACTQMKPLNHED